MQEPDRAQQASPWHSGERAAQKIVGVAERMEEVGKRVIRPFMPDQHRLFFAGLPFVIVGSVDEEGWPFASILSGEPGFLQSPDAVTLDIAARPASGDPLTRSLKPGTRLGMLGIDLSTRRRNRVNGEIVRMDAKGFSLHVDQSFGNCAKYIQPRHHAGPRRPRARALQARPKASPRLMSARVRSSPRRTLSSSPPTRRPPMGWRKAPMSRIAEGPRAFSA